MEIYVVTYGQNYYEGGDRDVSIKSYVEKNRDKAVEIFFNHIDIRDEFVLDNLRASLEISDRVVFNDDNGLRSYEIMIETHKI